jgi:hypothetical protein
MWWFKKEFSEQWATFPIIPTIRLGGASAKRRCVQTGQFAPSAISNHTFGRAAQSRADRRANNKLRAVGHPGVRAEVGKIRSAGSRALAFWDIGHQPHDGWGDSGPT